MPVAEQVVIDIIANDKATSLLENVRGKLVEINLLSKQFAQTISNLGSNVNIKVPVTPTVTTPNTPVTIPTTQTTFNGYNRYNLPQIDTSSTKSATSALDEANKQLEKIRNIARNSIKINIDSGNVKSTSEKVHQLNNIINTIRNNTRTSFLGQNSNINGALVPIGETNLVPTSSNVNNALVPVKENAVALNKTLSDTTSKTNEFSNASVKAGKSSYSSFHQLNNMMVVVGGTFNNLSAQIAGIFGAAGLSGMIQKMWQGAAQRQQNMMYLMHQKGKEQATKYYNEIMDVVTQLPGDDTFLTNILNMATAMDKSIKLDNIKEVGSAITDYYMSATMKGENSYETQRDLRKYITTGNTRGLQNSIIASEIDLLKDKNTVLERTQALEKALEKTGFSGMSGYESAINEFEELKGHFQKAFADLGEAVIAVTQPLMQFYNTLDTMFGGRISQGIIVVATILIGLFATIGGGLVLLSSSFRMIEVVTLAVEGLNFALSEENANRSILNTLLLMSISRENREAIATDGNVAAKMRATFANLKEAIATKLGVEVKNEEAITLGVLTRAVYANIVAKLRSFVANVRETIAILAKIYAIGRENNASLSQIIIVQLKVLATRSDTVAIILNTISKLRGIAITIITIGLTIVSIIKTYLQTDATFAEAVAHATNIAMKVGETEATIGLATAVGILNLLLAPEMLIIMAIVGAVIALIVVIEKLGEALGWWKDFGSMFQAISDGINRLWNAFANSDIIRGISQYFGDFIATIQEMFQSIYDMLSMIFGWEDINGTFDIVQSIIDAFGKLGEMLKWVWNLLDDWSNSPLGFVTTWLTPLGILIFHLDELGSWFEDIRDAIDRFTQTTEFQELITAWNEAISALQEPFQEIWSLINEIIGVFSEIFSAEDPEGQGTEGRINALVEVFKVLAMIIRVTIIPAIRGLALVIRILLTPLRVVLSVIKFVGEAIRGVTGESGKQVNGLTNIFFQLINVLNSVFTMFRQFGNVVTNPLKLITGAINGFRSAFDKVISIIRSFIVYIIQVINYLHILDPVISIINFLIQQTMNLITGLLKPIQDVANAVKNSIIGKLLGWDKEDNDDDNDDGKSPNGNVITNLYDTMRNSVANSDMNGITKHQILGELDKQKLTSSNVNDVRNLGSTYNNNNNQRQVVINQNFSEGSMPIDARNMTKKEARKMFIGAFGYRRAVGHTGILR